MKRLLVFLLIVGVVASFPLTSEGRKDQLTAALDGVTDNPTFLVAGVDNAAENTDFILLAVYEASTNSFNFLQIPRDTFCSGKVENKKINGIYAKERAKDKTSYESMETLARFVSENFGIRIDGFVSYNLKALERLVDSVGGINLSLPYSLDILDSSGKTVLSLNKGENHLSGKDSVTYIRHRKSYATQDLGRLDAQKLFLSAFLESFKSEMGFQLAARFILDRGEGISTNLKVADFVNLLVKNKGRISNLGIRLATFPGRAVTDKNGISYYSVNRAAGSQILSELGFSKTRGFDERRVFRNAGEQTFSDVYDSSDVGYTVYDGSSVKDIVPK